MTWHEAEAGELVSVGVEQRGRRQCCRVPARDRAPVARISLRS